MNAFLTWIGAYNLLGAPLLASLLDARVADAVLRRATAITTEPVRHEGLARTWLWWAASAQLFVGAVMLRARQWPAPAQRDVVAITVGLYASMLLALLVAGRRPGFGPGVAVTAVLWGLQLGWGLAALGG
ncbi:MAG: hypothetical protein FJ086_18895 [Deltaproteobacteria bacterium]|nr:hypothetical protein [Deltaproteobacteria bacterium]